MKYAILILIGFFVLNVESQTKGRLVWSDEFDQFDKTRWTHLVTGWRGGNNEFQYYTNRPENSYVKNGVLYIKPTLTASRFGEDFLYRGTLDLNKEGCNFNIDNGCKVKAGSEIINPIQSARIYTRNSFSFTYGVVEIRAKMPRGDWLWPAIWMLPTDEYYGQWPRSGEIDIVESRGNNDFRCGGDQQGNRMVSSALHRGPDPQRNVYDTWRKVLPEPKDFASDFHIFGLEWRPTGITFYVDGEQIGSLNPPSGGFWELGRFTGDNLWHNGTKMAPFDRRFHFVLNVAVGGNFFGDHCAPKPWSTNGFPQMRPFWEQRNAWLPSWKAETDQNAMQIDYIRVYKL